MPCLPQLFLAGVQVQGDALGAWTIKRLPPPSPQGPTRFSVFLRDGESGAEPPFAEQHYSDAVRSDREDRQEAAKQASTPVSPAHKHFSQSMHLIEVADTGPESTPSLILPCSYKPLMPSCLVCCAVLWMYVRSVATGRRVRASTWTTRPTWSAFASTASRSSTSADTSSDMWASSSSIMTAAPSSSPSTQSRTRSRSGTHMHTHGGMEDTTRCP